MSLYEARGEFQVVVEHLEEAGEGLLRCRFEELKARLGAEGLFDERHRKPLPRLPRRIGVVTSPTGAALREILHVLRRRFPAIPGIIYPTQVQGEAARQEIVAAIGRAAARAECDVLIVARGGGSLEDLWCFNDERVARAIFEPPVPVASGTDQASRQRRWGKKPRDRALGEIQGVRRRAPSSESRPPADAPIHILAVTLSTFRQEECDV